MTTTRRTALALGATVLACTATAGTASAAPRASPVPGGPQLNDRQFHALPDSTPVTAPTTRLALRAIVNIADSVDLEGCTFFIVTVPTPVDDANRPDLGPLEAASTLVGSLLAPGNVVVFESTVYPGTTEEVCVPLLEQASGFVLDRDFHCGYSPERINPGDKEHRLPSIKKVTSGSTPDRSRSITPPPRFR